MKKFSLFLVFATFLVTGCRENYLAERAFFKANKVLATITANDFKTNPDKALEPAIKAFEQVAEKYPTSFKAAESLFKVAEFRVRGKKFDEAIKALAKVIPNFTGKGGWAAEARFRIAQLYEVQGFWTKAEKSYWETAEYHPLESRGLYAPLYLVLHYKQLKDTVKQDEAYQKAVEHYERTLRTVGPIEVSAAIKNSLALCHLSQGNQKEARAEWLSIAEEFPKSAYGPLALLTVAELSWKQKDYEQAFRDYGYFSERYPQHPLIGKTAVHVGLLYEARGEFSKGREWFQRAATDYFKKDPSGTADLKLLIGKSYQDEGKWAEAEKVYQDLETNHSMTPAALQVPFMRFLHYKSLGEIERANQILDRAVELYKKLVYAHPNSKIAGYAKKFMFSAYTQKKDWDQLMMSVEQELKNETVQERKGRWLFLKALIAENRLKDRERALMLYQDFLGQYPGHPLSQLAKSHQEILSQGTIS